MTKLYVLVKIISTKIGILTRQYTIANEYQIHLKRDQLVGTKDSVPQNIKVQDEN